VLDTDNSKRMKNLDEHLDAFPYVNGKLFEEPLRIAAFDSSMRDILIQCSTLDWGKISPAIFGSMFQSVMNPQERRNLGAHYTSEKNILKLIKPLFLDDLHTEFEKVKVNKKKLAEFHQKLGTLKFLDPACGCGNFLIITYRELRLLELEILKVLYGKQQVTSIEHIMHIDVDQFFGIEYDEFPAKIAEVALWLMDHQMNMLVSEEFGLYYARLPLEKSATIVHDNALTTDWQEVVPKDKLSYILGNPPFLGKKEQNKAQKDDLKQVFQGVKGAGVLDYVTAWYVLAAQYMQDTNIKAAFVSTNSIAQGEQVGILWGELFNQYHIKIHFAHRTFSWKNEAKGNAAVHVVIVGFAAFDSKQKQIFEYDDIKGESHVLKAKNINTYLVEGG
ncbi:MAG: N-6 DNA methylase, partial [Ghiorsea sp.]|nr:N-6 DNA methylase [Ghiorsea sp.]